MFEISMKTSTYGMQTAHPELHVAQQKMRAALQDAVARGRSKPEMEVRTLYGYRMIAFL